MIAKIITSEKVNLLDTNLCSFLYKNGYSLDWFNSVIADIVHKNKDDYRSSIVEIALFLSNGLEEIFNIKLPYFLGGGHGTYNKNPQLFKEFFNDFLTKKTINPDIGTPLTKMEQDKYKFGECIYTHYGYDCVSLILYILKTIGFPIFNKSADIMKNGYLNENTNEIIFPMGDIYTNTSFDCIPYIKEFDSFYHKYSLYNIKKGDILHFPGHVMIITNINDYLGRIELVEEKGLDFGLVRSFITFKQLEELSNFSIINLDRFLTDTDNILKIYKLDEYLNNNIVTHELENQIIAAKNTQVRQKK